MDYDTVQQQIDDCSAPEGIALLKEIGEARIHQEQLRGGASLPKPEQEVTQTSDGHYEPVHPPTCAGRGLECADLAAHRHVQPSLMLQARVGILRTMPPPDDGAIARFRRQAVALGVPWQQAMPYGEFLRSLDRSKPRHLALIYAATSLFRGAAYTAFDGQLPDQPVQAAVAAPYAHVTARCAGLSIASDWRCARRCRAARRCRRGCGRRCRRSRTS